MHRQGLTGRTAHRRITGLLAAIVASSLSLACAACGQGRVGPLSVPPRQEVALRQARVEIFVPADPLNLSPSTPANKWGNLAASLSSQLEKAGYEKSSIQIVTSATLAAQAQALSRHAADLGTGTTSGSRDLVIVAPAISLSATGAQLGGLLGDSPKQLGSSAAAFDSVDQLEAAEQTGSTFGVITSPASTTDTAAGSTSSARKPTDSTADSVKTSTDNSKSDSTSTKTGKAKADVSRSADIKLPTWSGGLTSTYIGQSLPQLSSADEAKLEKQVATDKQAEQSLVQTCAQLRAKKVSLIMLSKSLPGIHPTAFAQTASPDEIGAKQAQQLAAKLELSATSPADPKRVEILLPNGDPQTAREFFNGIWSVLGPYFKKGVLISPSGRLNRQSVAADWSNLLVSSGSATQAQKDFSSILQVAREIYACHRAQGQVACPPVEDIYTDASLKARTAAQTSKGDTIVPLDGIITAGDFLADQAVTVLSQQGYVGTAADINPDISIGGIIGNLTGNGDLIKHKVPLPVKASGRTAGQDSQGADKLSATSWPIVIGWGAAQANTQLVVSGKQWMTGLVDRLSLAKDLAAACKSLTLSHAVSLPGRQRLIEVNGQWVPLIGGDLVPVVASNLKAALIDTGYLSAADAGL